MQTNSFAGELSNVLNNEISEVRKQAYDQLKTTEEELVSQFGGKFETVAAYLDKNITRLNSQTDKSSEQITKSIK